MQAVRRLTFRYLSLLYSLPGPVQYGQWVPLGEYTLALRDIKIRRVKTEVLGHLRRAMLAQLGMMFKIHDPVPPQAVEHR